MAVTFDDMLHEEDNMNTMFGFQKLLKLCLRMAAGLHAIAGAAVSAMQNTPSLSGGCVWISLACNLWLSFLSAASHERSASNPYGNVDNYGIRSLSAIGKGKVSKTLLPLCASISQCLDSGCANSQATLMSGVILLLHSRGVSWQQLLGLGCTAWSLCVLRSLRQGC